MSGTLHELLTARGAGFGAYDGAEVAMTLADRDRQWRAFVGGAALLDFGFRRDLVATGEELADFLHGQVSADIRGLAQARGCAALVLTAQGRPLALTAVYRDADHHRIVGDAAGLEPTRTALERFLVADDCEFEFAPPSARIGLVGPGAPGLLAAAGIEGWSGAPEWAMARGMVAGHEVTALARGDLGVAGFDLCVDAEGAVDVWQRLEQLDAVAAGMELFEVMRVRSGTARYGVDVDDSRLALEARLEWAIHFAKGCYVGQEVIERAVSRGRLPRELARGATAGPWRAGAVLEGGSPTEVVTSSVVVPCAEVGADTNLSFVYLPLASCAADTQVELRDAAGVATARVLPWPRSRVLAGRRSAGAAGDGR